MRARPLFRNLTRSRAPADITRASARRSPARLRTPHPLQHVLHRACGKRELLRVARAQHHVGIGPVLRIEERIAANRDFGIGLGDLAELGADVALARVTLLITRSAPLGMRVMRSRASFISAPVARSRSCRMARARGSTSIGTPNALATQSAVMSSWVGPIPPVVKT